MATIKLRLPKFSILRMFCFVILLPTTMVFITIATMHHDSREFKVTHEVYFDVESEGQALGRMVMGLFGEAAPLTVENFMTFATKGHKGYKYKGTTFHRVIKKFMIQGGDVVSGDGMGTVSIYGPTFPDETLHIKHSRPGFLSMANQGKDTNGCQFFITTIATPWLDGHHVVFGKIVKGESVLHKIEYLPTDWNDRPLKHVIIAKCGGKVVNNPYYITDDPYNLKDWLKTISIPLGLSFTIIAIFNYFIKKMDSCIIDDDGSMDDDETRQRKMMQEDDDHQEQEGDTILRKRTGRLDDEE
ncbi:uncharacterized protein [Panulirus ornatus]|uniref:uncharacterized protein n=1 Tax=Panulirus ornatus TaxID=150431 RepID=UPI003A8C6623